MERGGGEKGRGTEMKVLGGGEKGKRSRERGGGRREQGKGKEGRERGRGARGQGEGEIGREEKGKIKVRKNGGKEIRARGEN